MMKYRKIETCNAATSSGIRTGDITAPDAPISETSILYKEKIDLPEFTPAEQNFSSVCAPVKVESLVK